MHQCYIYSLRVSLFLPSYNIIHYFVISLTYKLGFIIKISFPFAVLCLTYIDFKLIIQFILSLYCVLINSILTVLVGSLAIPSQCKALLYASSSVLCHEPIHPPDLCQVFITQPQVSGVISENCSIADYALLLLAIVLLLPA